MFAVRPVITGAAAEVLLDATGATAAATSGMLTPSQKSTVQEYNGQAQGTPSAKNGALVNGNANGSHLHAALIKGDAGSNGAATGNGSNNLVSVENNSGMALRLTREAIGTWSGGFASDDDSMPYFNTKEVGLSKSLQHGILFKPGNRGVDNLAAPSAVLYAGWPGMPLLEGMLATPSELASGDEIPAKSDDGQLEQRHQADVRYGGVLLHSLFQLPERELCWWDDDFEKWQHRLRRERHSTRAVLKLNENAGIPSYARGIQIVRIRLRRRVLSSLSSRVGTAQWEYITSSAKCKCASLGPSQHQRRRASDCRCNSPAAESSDPPVGAGTVDLMVVFNFERAIVVQNPQAPAVTADVNGTGFDADRMLDFEDFPRAVDVSAPKAGPTAALPPGKSGLSAALATSIVPVANAASAQMAEATQAASITPEVAVRVRTGRVRQPSISASYMQSNPIAISAKRGSEPQNGSFESRRDNFAGKVLPSEDESSEVDSPAPPKNQNSLSPRLLASSHSPLNVSESNSAPGNSPFEDVGMSPPAYLGSLPHESTEKRTSMSVHEESARRGIAPLSVPLDTLVVPLQVPLLAGEQVRLLIPDTELLQPLACDHPFKSAEQRSCPAGWTLGEDQECSPHSVYGSLVLTNYRLMFVPRQMQDVWAASDSVAQCLRTLHEREHDNPALFLDNLLDAAAQGAAALLESHAYQRARQHCFSIPLAAIQNFERRSAESSSDDSRENPGRFGGLWNLAAGMGDAMFGNNVTADFQERKSGAPIPTTGFMASFVVDIVPKLPGPVCKFGFATQRHGNAVDILLTILNSSVFPSSGSDGFVQQQAAMSKLRPVFTSNVERSWSIYDADREFVRMGAINDDGTGVGSHWRMCRANRLFALCETYPEHVCVPLAISDERLAAASKFRTKNRFPILCWRDRDTGVTLTRASQPKTGVASWSRSHDDEALLGAIRACGAVRSHGCTTHELSILDARHWVNAAANTVNGGGYESINYYPQCQLQWLDIRNIHAVRESWEKLRDVCASSACLHSNVRRPNQPPPAASALAPGSAHSGGHHQHQHSRNRKFWSQLENTGWPEQVCALLEAALTTVNLMTLDRRSVLIHCSDGWDRTPQIASLAQILMDPYFRTMEGLCVLIDKEWISAGHKFAERHGYVLGNVPRDQKKKFRTNRTEADHDTVHATNTVGSNERSPAFVMFLDCVYQVVCQFPTAFEFRSEFLEVLVRHSYSGRHGTFMCSNPSERLKLKLSGRTANLWSDLLPHRRSARVIASADLGNSWYNAYFSNPYYFETTAAAAGVLRPDADARSFEFWSGLYLGTWNAALADNLALRGQKAALAAADDMRSTISELQDRVAELTGTRPPSPSPHLQLDCARGRGELKTEIVPLPRSFRRPRTESLSDTSTWISVDASTLPS